MGFTRSVPVLDSYKSGRLYTPFGNFSQTTLALVLDQQYFIPLEFRTPASFNAYAIGVTSAAGAGGVIRFSFFNDLAGDPGGNPIEEQTVATTSTGSRLVAFSATRTLFGKLWLAVTAQVATCTTRSIVSGVSSRIGHTDANDMGVFRYKTGVTGAYPAISTFTGVFSVGPAPTLRAV